MGHRRRGSLARAVLIVGLAACGNGSPPDTGSEIRLGVQPPGHLDSGRIDCATIEPAYFEVLDLPQFEKDLAIETDHHLIELLRRQPELLCATLHSERGGGEVSVLAYAVAHRPNLETLFSELIRRGADPDTALAVAACLGKTRYLSMLLEAGADPNAGDALIVAVACRRGQLMLDLLEAGADADRRAQAGSFLGDREATALHYATEQGRTDLMGALLEAGANVDVLDRNGEPPLQSAVQHQNAAAVRLLMENNAYPFLMEDKWVERLDRLARQYHMTEIVEMLEQ